MPTTNNKMQKFSNLTHKCGISTRLLRKRLREVARVRMTFTLGSTRNLGG